MDPLSLPPIVAAVRGGAEGRRVAVAGSGRARASWDGRSGPGPIVRSANNVTDANKVQEGLE